MRRNARLLNPAWLITLLAGCSIPIQIGSSSSDLSADGTTSGDGTQTVPTTDGLATEFPDCQEPGQASAWRARILELVNTERTAAGERPLTRSAVLEAQAEQYACQMIHYNFFEHVNPVTGTNLEERAQEFGYDWMMLGENLAAGQTTPEEAFESWMNSAEHRENILRSGFTELGVGVRTGGRFGIYWVQEFGAPMP